MKTIKINIYILLAALAVLVSCGKDKPASVAKEEPGEQVVILLSTNSRSGDEEYKPGDPEDRKVASLRLLAYKHSTGILYNNYILELPEVEDPQMIEILTGRYDFVFIANEGELSAALAGQTAGVSHISALKELSFPASSFSSTKPIPMVTECREIVIVGDSKYIDTENSEEIKEGVWPVELERLGVRIDAKVTFNEDHTPSEWELILSEVPECVYLIAGDRSVTRNNNTISYGTGIGTGKVYSWSRIIIPANVFDPVTDVSNATKIGVRKTDLSKKYNAPIGKNLITKDYTLPRNTWVGVDASISDRIILGSITVSAWDNPQDVVVPL